MKREGIADISETSLEQQMYWPLLDEELPHCIIEDQTSNDDFLERLSKIAAIGGLDGFDASDENQQKDRTLSNESKEVYRPLKQVDTIYTQAPPPSSAISKNSTIEKPKRPLSPYNVFYYEQRLEMKGQTIGYDELEAYVRSRYSSCPPLRPKRIRTRRACGRGAAPREDRFGALTKEIANRWSNLSPAIKQCKYQRLGDLSKHLYDQAMMRYRDTTTDCSS